MPTYTGTLSSIDQTAVKEYASQRGQDLSDHDVQEACKTVLRLASPQGVFQQGFYDQASQHLLCSHPFQLRSTQLVPYLEQAHIILIGAVTIGAAVEKEIDDAFLQHNVAGGVALDSAAAAATGTLLDQLTDYIRSISEDKGYKVVWRFSPGNGDWPAGQQTDVANAAGGSQIGMAVTPGGMLSPRRSLTALFGLHQADGCAGSCSGCAMAGHCGG
ncbi:hypothetical protein [uncultured Megasphaera sp.]|uniref:hypothetical protein n=1 Tax=uncultured Megasphaera sp. TaxID=165188 RepID=UPI002657AE44|nr:hypothetical protein [uncultured Megasphaera sp.]